MGEKFRNIERTPWKSVLDRDFAYCELPEFDGVCSLIRFNKLASPSFCTYDDGIKITIIDEGYFWLQLAPKNELFWLTALFDKDGKFDHAYFDMTDYNVIDGKRTYFCDLYLDVAIKSHGEVFILDEDELLAALDGGEITKYQYEKAHRTAKKVIDDFGGENVSNLISLCEKYFAYLLPELDRRQTFEMNLTHEPFEKILRGEKTIELRLNDEKRQKICVGDIINFACGDKNLRVKVVDLYRERDFITLFEKYPMAEMGFQMGIDAAGGAEQMRAYYSEKNEKEHGVLGIKIKLI
ncbi:MAG: DUF402 domain-containing protein [Clostridia bacterium]|nr:DUF402 domain-containing protein [Clostridia bacterium]